jgi:hypothetical protein
MDLWHFGQIGGFEAFIAQCTGHFWEPYWKVCIPRNGDCKHLSY